MFKYFKFLFLIFFFLFFFMPLNNVRAEISPINVYVFTQAGCPHCAKAVSHLEALQRNHYPEMNIFEYNLIADRENIAKFQKFVSAYEVNFNAVPAIFVGKSAIKGYHETEIDLAVEKCKNEPCPDALDIVNEKSGESMEQIDPESAEQEKSLKLLGMIVSGTLILGGAFIVIKKML